MQLPKDKTKYLASFKYVEVGHYVDSLQKLIREKQDKEPLLIDYEDVELYADKNKRYGIFQSVFQYNSQRLDSAACVGPLFFDIDSDNPEVSKDEATKLVNYLLSYISEDGIRAYFSGQKGFHIECEPIALGLSPNDDLPGIFRFIAGYISDELGLTGIDYHVYDRRRMWRVPNTLHQRTGLFKVECMQLLRDSSSASAILDLAQKPQPIDVPEQHLQPIAHRWFKDMEIAWEEATLKTKNHYSNFNNFLRSGTKYMHNDEALKIFTPNDILQKCAGTKYLYDKARKDHNLDHYERLFLCSLFTYTDDAIDFLHKEILSKCDDYNYIISDSHVQDWIRRRENGSGGRPFTCEKARQVGIICQNCDDLKPTQRRVNGQVLEGEYAQPSPVRFLYRYQDKEKS